MPVEVFTVFWYFKQNGLAKPEEMANNMRDIFEKYPHWGKSDKQEIEVRSELYDVLLQAGLEVAQVTEMAQNIMKLLKRGVAS
jgi:hypothetical protein